MLEPLRSHYLDALGIEMYVPRFVLPAAKASAACEWLIDIEKPLQVAAVIAEIPQSSIPNTPKHTPIARDIDIQPARVAPTPPASMPVKSAVTNTVAAPKFALSVTFVDGDILLIDDAPATNAERSEFQKLLTNFLFALRHRPVQFSLDIFLWPMLKSTTVQQDATAAREALNAYLQKQMQQRNVQRVLILGATAQEWCVLEDRPQLHCLRSVSLLQCLREPKHKRELWDAVRALSTS